MSGLRTTINERSGDPEESYADAFAAALLMPAAYVHAFVAKGLSERQMAVEFGVPVEAVRFRLSMLDLL